MTSSSWITVGWRVCVIGLLTWFAIMRLHKGPKNPMVRAGEVYFVAGETQFHNSEQTTFWNIHIINKEMSVAEWAAEVVKAKRAELDTNKIMLTALNKIGD